jgi:hypothetical protein
MQIAEAIAEQMGCEHEHRGNTSLGERLGKAWGGYLGPAIMFQGFRKMVLQTGWEFRGRKTGCSSTSVRSM